MKKRIPKWLARVALDAAGIGRLSRSIGIKLSLIIFFCIFVLVLVLGLFSYRSSKQIIEAKVSDMTSQTIEQAADKIDLLMQNLGYVSGQILNDSSFMKTAKEYVALPDHAPDKIMLNLLLVERLNNITDINQGIVGVYILPVNGSRAVANSSDAVREVSQEKWFKQVVGAGGSLVWLEPQITKLNPNEADELFAVARVLRGDKAGNDFVFLMEIKLSVLGDALSRIKLGDEGRIVLLAEGNRLVFSQNREQIGRSFDITLESEWLKQSFSRGLTKITDRHGEAQMVALKQMIVSGWYIAAVAPMSDLIKETKQILNVTLLVTLASMLIAVMLGAWIFRRIGRPLAALRNMMQEGEKGNLTERANFRGSDEIGQLAASYNRMMEQITALVKQANGSAVEVLETSERLITASKQTTASAREIAVATEEIASGASVLAIQAEQGNDLTVRLADKVVQVVQANVQMGEAVDSIRESSGRGTSNMKQLTSHTNRMEKMISVITDKIKRLEGTASSIRKILEMLNGITQQTNILSLNATIEAARAGESGKGFMVVAGEIRKLAEQSKLSIEEVDRFTQTIRLEINETAAALSEAYPVFREQMSSVNETDRIFGQVQLEMDQFSEKLSSVNVSIQELDDMQMNLIDTISNVSAVSEESSATSQEVASLSQEQLHTSQTLVQAAEGLERMSKLLKDALNHFKI